MSETLDTISKSIDVAEQFVDAPPHVIILVTLIVFCVAAYKLSKIVLTHVTTRERRYGRVKALAVAHKAKAENISPESALIQINESLKGRQ